MYWNVHRELEFNMLLVDGIAVQYQILEAKQIEDYVKGYLNLIKKEVLQEYETNKSKRMKKGFTLLWFEGVKCIGWD